MSEAENKLRDRIRVALRRGEGNASFDELWQRAEAAHAASRRRYTRFAAAAAIIATVAVVVGIQARIGEPAYIDAAELLGSTSWSAPSDALMPDREFDIYQELPVLFEST